VEAMEQDCHARSQTTLPLRNRRRAVCCSIHMIYRYREKINCFLMMKKSPGIFQKKSGESEVFQLEKAAKSHVMFLKACSIIECIWN